MELLTVHLAGPGIFWGILILIWGLLLVIRQLFNLEFPVGKVMLGLFLIMMGIKLLFFRTHEFNYSDDNNIVFGNKELSYSENEYEYNVVFSSSVLDLRNINESPEHLIEINTVFGDTKVLLNPGTKVDINSDAVFGSVQHPGAEKLPIEMDSLRIVPTDLKIKATAVFGNIKFTRE